MYVSEDVCVRCNAGIWTGWVHTDVKLKDLGPKVFLFYLGLPVCLFIYSVQHV